MVEYTKCLKCGEEGLVWRYSDLKGKSVLFNASRELPHDCKIVGTNPNNNMLDEWSKKYHESMKFKMDIWCHICEVHYNKNSVCGHILKTGFKEGVDTIEYFTDRWDMIELRRKRQKEMKLQIMKDREHSDQPKQINTSLTKFFKE
jgi:hypothetical protein